MGSQPLNSPQPLSWRRPILRVIAGGTIIVIGAVTLVLAIQPAYGIGTAPDLGTASAYSVLAGASVTNTGPTVLSADLGVSPGTEISGFPPGVVNGTIYPGQSPHPLQAQEDLVEAYNDAAQQAADASISDDLGGLTLTPGVYNSTSSIGLTGPLTLDAQGNPNAVFVFQIGSALTTATSSSVVLANGASSCNVFWQVSSSATLGTNSVFVGNILALTSITVNSGTIVDGRALARNGSVTLDTNVFSNTSCATTTPPTTTPPTTAPPTTTPPGPSGSPQSSTPPLSGGGIPPSGSAPESSAPLNGGDFSPSAGAPSPDANLPVTGSPLSVPLIAGAATAILLGMLLAASGYRSSRQRRIQA